MDNIPKFLVSLVCIMFCLMIGVSLVFANFYITEARSYHDTVIKAISGSDFSAPKVQECIADAQAKGFAVSVEQSADGYVYKVNLTYSINVPFFGAWGEKTISGYAVDYAAMAATHSVEIGT